MSLETIARRARRAQHDFLVVTAAALTEWAGARNLTLYRAHELALEAGIFPECFERNFPSLSAAVQLRLWQSRVLVAGLGGLGGYLIELLARAGVGCFLVADGDSFAPSNLNRQLLATQATLGQNKAQAAARRLAEINPGLQVQALAAFLDEANLPALLRQVQVAVDGLDNLPARLKLAAAAHAAGAPLVHGAVVGRFGQVTTMLPEEVDGYARLSRLLAGEPEASREVLAPTVALTASLQVQEAIRLLLGEPPAYRGALAHFDGDTGRLEIVPLA